MWTWIHLQTQNQWPQCIFTSFFCVALSNFPFSDCVQTTFDMKKKIRWIQIQFSRINRPKIYGKNSDQIASAENSTANSMFTNTLNQIRTTFYLNWFLTNVKTNHSFKCRYTISQIVCCFSWKKKKSAAIWAKIKSDALESKRLKTE